MTSATEAANGTAATAAGETLAAARAFIQSAKFAEAERLLVPLPAQNPDTHTAVEALYALAVARRYQGNHGGALEALNELLTMNPEYSRACQEYGHTCLAANDPESAISAYKRAVELNPGLAASWKALAGLHDRAGRSEQARFAKAQADYLASLPPELAGVIDLLHEGKLHKAESVCRGFLQKNRQHVEGMRLLADIGVRLRIYDDAEFLLESCVEFEPDNARARADYLKVLNRKGKFEKAFEQAEVLVGQYPDSPAYQLSLASALAGLGRYDEAIERYRACLGDSPNKAGVHVLLGHALKAVGALDEAVDSYRAAYRLRPDYGDAFWSLANTKTYRFTDDEIKHIEDQEQQPRVSAEDRIHLCFAAGKAHEDRQDFATSFDFYERGNALKMARSGYDPERTSGMVDAQIATCTADLFERLGNAGCDSPDPIFIVGLPRAGSTLLEQILASHSDG
ncbi:MAG: tetratricopeptide repeat protein [Woeseiaceae bacterium]|nr:tetratricopeptide repeat protein [Woeseiaceae bacterium]